ncbi:hypothetical protein BC832DRAFT_555956 [Gaertneriomyces semiglobifer]|nr:hypothetical protein BC832DRAFT_555956 [Gaertneriomyces semiglobifer]
MCARELLGLVLVVSSLTWCGLRYAVNGRLACDGGCLYRHLTGDRELSVALLGLVLVVSSLTWCVLRFAVNGRLACDGGCLCWYLTGRLLRIHSLRYDVLTPLFFQQADWHQGIDKDEGILIFIYTYTFT